MASAVLTVHDSLGDLVVATIPLPTATPGTPTAETVFDVRNNDAGAASIDTASNVKITLLGRLAGDVDDPTNAGILFLAQRALQIRVSAVSGGATAQVTGWRAIGNAAAFSIDQIPSGGIVTLGLRVSASLVATLAQVQLYLAIEEIQSTPMPAGTYETHGNWIFDGRPGGKANPLFTMIRSETGTWTINGPADDSINTPTRARYTLAGEPLTYAPTTPSETFDDKDGDLAALLATEAYYAGLAYNASGGLTIPKGSKAVAPLTDDDKPTPAAGEIIRLWVVVPFGLAIDTIELVGEIGFFHLEVVSGLNVTVGPAIAAVGERRVETQTATSLTLADDSSLTIWRQPESGLEVIATSASPTDPWSMPLWDVVTASGAVTSTTDRRVIGLPGAGGSDMSRFETLFGADWNPNADLELRAVAGARQLIVAEIADGSATTVSTTAGSTAMTGAATTFTTGTYPAKLLPGSPVITAGGNVYRVQSVGSDTAATLERRVVTAETTVAADTAPFEEIKPFLASDPIYGEELSKRTLTKTATPLTISVASSNANDSSAGTGAREVTVRYIDSTGAEAEEIVQMNGTTEVALADTGFFVNDLAVTEVGSNFGQLGDIYVGFGTFTAGVPADILAKAPLAFAAGFFSPGTSPQAVFCIPVGRLGQISSLRATAEDAAELRLYVQRPAVEVSGPDGPTQCIWSGMVGPDGIDYEFAVPLGDNLPAESFVFAHGMTRSAGPVWVAVTVGVALLEV